MSYGRGRGRGRGSFGGIGYTPPKPFVIFPEITLPDPNTITKDTKLVSSYFSFQKFWRNSSYYLGDGVSKQENESLDIERFSDALDPKKKKSSNKSGSFYDYLVLRPDNFPKELLGDARRERPTKRAKWSVVPDFKKLDVFEKLEEKLKAEGKEENEEEGEEEVEESDEEDSDNGDYDQNQDFDDDDDDYNQASDGDFEQEVTEVAAREMRATGTALVEAISQERAFYTAASVVARAVVACAVAMARLRDTRRRIRAMQQRVRRRLAQARRNDDSYRVF
ncbi:hypothetical protein AALP_AA6G014900 [Arabis alpina]|uniref:DNA-directed RNA polymerase III subunit n=1 Tax=Arabis alpina TaxID=50452 RepID=A0A087GLD5_ARAAL|nr:hypothetical protein AALP_AA6G014900 [Arabis alpina]